MTQTNSTKAENSRSSSRSGASRKLLARMALETTPAGLLCEPGIEASFPPAADSVAPDGEASARTSAVVPAKQLAPAASHQSGDRTESGPTAPADPHLATVPGAAPGWSEDDEAALQALIARRKAAGCKRRGRDIGGQVIRAGNIKPNEGTIVSMIVALVGERSDVTRAELVKLMAGAAFPHAKARPTDPSWCQGYVAGAIRSGYLVADDANTAAQEV